MSADREPPILYARDARGRYLFIDDVANGDACGCVCPACGQPMRARNAGLERRHSFAHQPGMTCTWAVEAVITMLTKQAIEESGLIALPALYYANAVSGLVERLSPSRIMRATKVETVDIAGRQAPCLVVTVKGGEQTARFGLCVTLRRELTFEQKESLLEGTRGIVLVNLGIDLAQQRSKLGKHYDRDELIKGYQDKDYLAEVMTKMPSDLMSWERNLTQSERERQSVAEKAEIDRKESEARAQAKREREEARRREEEARKQADEERAAKEAREGIVKKPDCYVTEYEEYDVRRWDDRHLIDQRVKLAPNERYVANGALKALISDMGDSSCLTMRCEMKLDPINEVSWKLDELLDGFSTFALALYGGILKEQGMTTLSFDTDGKAFLTINANAREYCCALQGLVVRGIRVVVYTSDGRGRAINRVDVNAGKVFFK